MVPFFQNLVSHFIWRIITTKMKKFYISVKLGKPFGCGFVYILYIQGKYNFYVSFNMVTITSNLFIDIFQTQHLWAAKFYMGYEKIMRYLVIAKSPKVGGKVERIGLGSFKCHMELILQKCVSDPHSRRSDEYLHLLDHIDRT